MRILLISSNSMHFLRWTEQLIDSGHEVYWFDILDGGYSKSLSWVKQSTGWKQRYPNLKGRYFVKKRLPIIYKLLRPLIEEKPSIAFEKYLNETKPDVVHSLDLYKSFTSILSVMIKYKKLPWIYSSWGSDLYYFMDLAKYRKEIQKVLSRVNYLITDCKRDVRIAKDLGFKNKVLGTFPKGGGFDLIKYNNYIIKPASERRTILVKGYQGKCGKSISVLKALKELTKELKNYKIIIFGADPEVVNYSIKNRLDNILNISIYKRSKFLPHHEILKLMGESLIYIGNNIYDGIPNTLLEAIGMGAFPIQSNPGGASEEVITNGENGLLINDIENIEEIKNLILRGLSNSKMVEKAFIINQMELKSNFEREKVKKEVLSAYNFVFKKIK